MTVPTTHSPESLSNAHTLVLRPGLVSAWWRLDAMTSRPIKEVWLSRPGSTGWHQLPRRQQDGTVRRRPYFRGSRLYQRQGFF